MAEIGCFPAGPALCAFVVLAIIAIIYRRFFLLMVDLCKGEELARFRTHAAEVWLAR